MCVGFEQLTNDAYGCGSPRSAGSQDHARREHEDENSNVNERVVERHDDPESANDRHGDPDQVDAILHSRSIVLRTE